MRSFAALIALALCGCNTTKPEPASANQQASLAGQLPYNPLAWKVVTSSVNHTNSTMSTLYGNDTAIAYARSTAGSTYPAGSVLALVTWTQRDDPHWFGAKIPSTPQSVEFVSFPAQSGQPATYELYRGSPLARVETIVPDEGGRRMEYLTTQRTAVMP
jgi:hypothetical protein